MNAREERGLVIAALCKLNKTPDGWLVPSQSGERIYRVNVEKQTCTCPDHQEGGFKCKHLYAVEFTMKREVNPDGTVTETKTRDLHGEDHVQARLARLQPRAEHRKGPPARTALRPLPGFDEPDRTGAGPQAAYGQAIRSSRCVFKVYSTFSSRRFSSDLREAHERGFLSETIPGLKVPQFMEEPGLHADPQDLIVLTSLPLRTVETKFAIDSSGFSTNKFERWYDHKYGVTRRTCTWVKVHIACGVKTNVVTAVRILDKDAGDSPQFAPLVKDTAKNFTIGEVSADKAYASVRELRGRRRVRRDGLHGVQVERHGRGGGLFEKMFHYFQFKQDEFLGTTTAVERRKHVQHGQAEVWGLGRSKTETAMVNEVLASSSATISAC